ncbi:MAG: amidase [Alphaproteobacteria bacterium]
MGSRNPLDAAANVAPEGAAAGAIEDRFGAFCRHTHVALRGSGAGPLAGRRFAVKDVFDIAGHRTGAGSPDWLRSHPPASVTARAVRTLLEAGADMVGKTHTDELAYSLAGQNVHYGTPVNPRAPDRIPGGSSSGSAVAVAGGLVDFALGTDCGGSVRLPASLCGCLGFRPTHGRISLEGIIPLAPSFDTVGWFARDPRTLESVAAVLLGDGDERGPTGRLLHPVDLFALVPPRVARALRPAVEAVRCAVREVDEVPIFDGIDADPVEVFRLLQGREAWRAHGAWIESARPALGPGIRERFDLASRVTAKDAAPAEAARAAIGRRLDHLLAADNVICLPTAPDVAPLLDAPLADVERFRARALRLLSAAGLAGAPQVTLPLASVEGCPLGLSLIGPRGRDAALLALARSVMARAGTGADPTKESHDTPS